MDTSAELNANGGFIVLTSFCNVVLWGGIYKSLGVLLPTLTDQFTDHTWLTGVVISFIGVSADLSGLFTTLLEDKFGRRRMLILSTLTVNVGLMLVPLATSIVHIAIVLAVVVGPAVGISAVLSKVLLGRHFNKRYTLANGISHTGQVVSLLAFAPMTQLFLDTYGWRGATLLLAGVCLHSVVCPVLVKEEKERYETPPDQHDHKETNSTGMTRVKSCFAHALSTVDLRILREFNFWVVFSCFFGARFPDNAWFLFNISHLQAKGFSPQTSAALCSAASVGYLVGCVMFSPLVDRGFLKCSTGVLISSLLLTLSLAIDPLLHEAWSIAVFTALFGLSSSAMYALTDVLTKELLGRERLTSAFAWSSALGVAAKMLGGFLPGWVYDSSGTYDLAFVIMGAAPAVAAIPLVIGKIWKEI
ncbi:monocarboxylate transporter 13-like [Acanthaster planci]|uniref:Monocarboxylate transporter 13-like n=1 Tax=Acanthaster planci TaxID=133434 RepID=A0A8B7XYC1_ACAPL|nr:monocarboxylate transporter 13-like [Acanthaster planci]